MEEGTVDIFMVVLIQKWRKVRSTSSGCSDSEMHPQEPCYLEMLWGYVMCLLHLYVSYAVAYYQVPFLQSLLLSATLGAWCIQGVEGG